MGDLFTQRVQETIIFEDDQSTMCLVRNQQVQGKTKHADIKYHFISDLVEAEWTKLTYCPPKNMVADMLTKG